MRAIDHGLSRLKFFPAMASGGITAETAADWLALDAVACVGGTWLVPEGKDEALDLIAERARLAATLGPRNGRGSALPA